MAEGNGAVSRRRQRGQIRLRRTKSMTWHHEVTGTEGNVILFGVNIFEHPWNRTGETAWVRDPRYGQTYGFPVYTVNGADGSRLFAAGEFSSGVWGFYVPNDETGRIENGRTAEMEKGQG